MDPKCLRSERTSSLVVHLTTIVSILPNNLSHMQFFHLLHPHLWLSLLSNYYILTTTWSIVCSSGWPIPHGLSSGWPIPHGLSSSWPIPHGLSSSWPIPHGLSSRWPIPHGLLSGIPTVSGSMSQTITIVTSHGVTNRSNVAKHATSPTSDLVVGPTNTSSEIYPAIYNSMTIIIAWKAITMKNTMIHVCLIISGWFPSESCLWNIRLVLDFCLHLFLLLCRYRRSKWWSFFNFLLCLAIAKSCLVKGIPLTLKYLIKDRGACFHMSFYFLL